MILIFHSSKCHNQDQNNSRFNLQNIKTNIVACKTSQAITSIKLLLLFLTLVLCHLSSIFYHFHPFPFSSIHFHNSHQLSLMCVHFHTIIFTFIHFHHFPPPLLSTFASFIHFYPLQVNHQVSLHARVTSVKFSAGFLTHKGSNQ